jgi:DNA-binding beta-propeller fold protein YncE
MRRLPRHLAAATFLLAVGIGFQQGSAPSAQPPGGTTLKRVAVIDLPGPPGQRFDYLAIDYDDHYLFSAHLGAGLLYVIDLRTHSLVKAISGVPGIEGVAYIPGHRKVYTSNWYENKVGVVDLGQMAVVKKLPTAEKPDGIAYAAPFHKAYVSDEREKAEAIIDVREDRIVKTLQFDSETGVPQYDPSPERSMPICRSEIDWP